MIRVRRTPDPTSAGSDASVLSLNEVFAEGSEQLVSFSSSSSESTPGDPVELSWQTDFAFSSLSIDQGIGDILPFTTAGSGRIVAEVSTDLIVWNGPPQVVLVSEIENPDGTTTIVYRGTSPIGDRPERREFIRVLVTEEP